MVKKKISIGILLSLWLKVVCAQTGLINGKVTTIDGNPAEYVNVVLLGTIKGTVVNATGTYELKNIKPGTYTVRASFVGLVPQNKQVIVLAGKTATVDFTLNENSEELKEVEVVANPSKYVTDYPSISLRLKTPLLEVPQNIQVVTKQVIQDQQIFDMLEGVTRNVSGVTRMEHWDNYAQINMRGSQIAAFRNGMNVQSTWGPLTEDMSSVERIEFVKGPAGFMLANGEPSGFYNVVTKKPTGISKGDVSMSVGSFNSYRTTLDLDGKVAGTDKLLFRLNVMGQMKDSYRENEFSNRILIAPVLKYQFTPNTSLTAEYTYQYVNMSPLGANYAFSARKMGELPVNFSTAEANMDPTIINDNSLFVTLAHSLNDHWKFTGQIAYLNFSQEGQTLWPSKFSNNGDTLFRVLSNWDVLGKTTVGQFFVNGDLKTGSINHRILIGLDMGNKEYYHDWSQSGNIGGLNIYNPVYGKVLGSSYPVYNRSISLKERGVYYSDKYSALYAQDEIRFFKDKLHLTLAGRYTTADDADPYSGAVKSAKFTPRFGLSYSITKNTSVYAVFDEAFVPQAGTDYNGKGFDPITGDNREIGLKQEWLDGLWTASVSAYQITKNKVLNSDPNHMYFSVQLGQTITKGFEFDLRGQIVQGLDATINYAYTDGKVTKNTDASLIGPQLPGTTKNIANAWLNYHFETGKLNGLGVSAGVQYLAGRTNWYGAYDNSLQKMPDYTRVDGVISYRLDKFSIALNMNNILGAYLYSGAYYSWSKFYYWQAEAKQNYRLSINYRF